MGHQKFHAGRFIRSHFPGFSIPMVLFQISGGAFLNPELSMRIVEFYWV